MAQTTFEPPKYLQKYIDKDVNEQVAAAFKNFAPRFTAKKYSTEGMTFSLFADREVEIVPPLTTRNNL